MDVSRLSQGEKIAGVAGILLFISMFFAWFGFDTGLGELESQLGVEVGETTFTFNAWESFSFIDLLLLLTAAVAAGTAAMRAADLAVGFPLNTGVTALGGLSAVFVLYRIIDTPGSADREWGVFVGLVLAVLIAYGGYRAMEEEGVTFSDAADRLSNTGASQSQSPSSGHATPPPAPPSSGAQQPPPPPAGNEPPAPPPPPSPGV